MRYSYILSIAILVSLSLVGCKKGIFGTAGKIVITERAILPYNRVNVYNNVNLIITQDTEDRIRIEAGENLQSSISTEMNDQALTIKNTAANWISAPDQKVNVYLSVKDLHVINYQGSGDISSTNTIQSDYFLVTTNEGAGNVKLSLNTHMTTAGIYNQNADFIFSGNSDSCYTYCSSRGTIDFRNFSVKRMEIDFSSARDGYISATESLRARIFYKGNLFYNGSPGAIIVQSTNDGKLIPL